MQVQVTEDTPRLDRIEEALKRKEYLRTIGNAGTADIKKNFTTQGQNIGRTWPPLTWRQGQTLGNGIQGPVQGAKRLRADGQLMRSIHAEITEKGVEIVATKQAKGHNIAHIQHYGRTIKVTKKMRNFLGWARGIWLRKDKKEIVIPATEFMTFSDRFPKRVKFILGKVFK